MMHPALLLRPHITLTHSRRQGRAPTPLHTLQHGRPLHSTVLDDGSEYKVEHGLHYFNGFLYTAFYRKSVSATTPHNSSNGKTSFRIFIISETDISTILRISVAPTQISNNVYSDMQMSSPF